MSNGDPFQSRPIVDFARRADEAWDRYLTTMHMGHSVRERRAALTAYEAAMGDVADRSWPSGNEERREGARMRDDVDRLLQRAESCRDRSREPIEAANQENWADLARAWSDLARYVEKAEALGLSERPRRDRRSAIAG